MQRSIFILLLVVYIAGSTMAQEDQTSPQDSTPKSSKPRKSSPPDRPPRSDRDQEADESSSADTRIDISPPKDDAKNHPFSKSTVSDAEDATSGSSDVSEFHPWDPHKALKDVEVGDFYFKRKNYHAALERYKDALYYKDNDAVATFRLAQCQEKLGEPEAAFENYAGYLKILPDGPFAGEARKAITRLKPQKAASTVQEKK
jgi:tetratricopeptide (TPR) repeat protein